MCVGERKVCVKGESLGACGKGVKGRSMYGSHIVFGPRRESRNYKSYKFKSRNWWRNCVTETRLFREPILSLVSGLPRNDSALNG